MELLWKTILTPGQKWSGNVNKGKSIRFTALEPGANISLLLFNSKDLTEKYNMPDTLKSQYTSKLTHGNVLMSDNGRVLASITEDTLGWHDTISGLTTRKLTDEKYGETRYQELRNEWLKSGYENFAIELIRNGLTVRDLTPNVNLFSKVYCDQLGEMHFDNGHCNAGDTITLRTEMDVLVILSNTPNPLDNSRTYPSKPVSVEVFDAEPIDFTNDSCVNYRSENRRSFENTMEYYSLTK